MERTQYVFGCMYVCMYIYIYIYMYLCVYMLYMCMYMYVYVCICVYIQTVILPNQIFTKTTVNYDIMGLLSLHKDISI